MRKRRVLKIGDIILLFIILIIISFAFSKYVFSGTGVYRVKITGRELQTYYSIDEDRIIHVQGPLGVTTVLIEKGEVRVEDSPCREKICIKMGKIQRTGEQLICVPNRVVVELEGERGEVDGVSR
jgi:hypothetical protein